MTVNNLGVKRSWLTRSAIALAKNAIRHGTRSHSASPIRRASVSSAAVTALTRIAGGTVQPGAQLKARADTAPPSSSAAPNARRTTWVFMAGLFQGDGWTAARPLGLEDPGVETNVAPQRVPGRPVMRTVDHRDLRGRQQAGEEMVAPPVAIAPPCEQPRRRQGR